MNIISFGNISINYYIKDNIVKYISGGGRAENILCNLASSFPCKYIGYSCNDLLGEIARNDLLNIDISNIKIIEGKTKINFIKKNKVSEICPYCNREYQYNTCEDIDYIVNNINEEDIILIDSIDEFHLNVIHDLNNKMILDLSNKDELINLTKDEFIEIVNKFSFINIHDNVYQFIKSKYNIDSTDIYDLSNLSLLIISKGKKGCDMLYQDEFDERIIEHPINQTNLCGDGDAFVSEMIKCFLTDDIDIKSISKAYIKASSFACNVIQNYSPREHLMKLHEIENYHECICSKITIK